MEGHGRQQRHDILAKLLAHVALQGRPHCWAGALPLLIQAQGLKPKPQADSKQRKAQRARITAYSANTHPPTHL